MERPGIEVSTSLLYSPTAPPGETKRKKTRSNLHCLVLVSVNGHKRDISYYHEKAFRIGMSKSPRKSFNRKSSSARQWKQNKKKKRIGGERKEFTNGTTGEACLAKPSVERLPKAKTPFFRVLPVWIDAFPSFQISLKNDLRNSQWEIPPCHRGASVTIHSIRRTRWLSPRRQKT